MSEFKVGDRVTWTSQSGGSTTTKTGVVWAVIENTRALWNTSDKIKEEKTHTKMFDGLTMLAPVMYIVEVQAGPKAKPRLYLPRPKQLKLVEEQ
jgi:hypothetical protein